MKIDDPFAAQADHLAPEMGLCQQQAGYPTSCPALSAAAMRDQAMTGTGCPGSAGPRLEPGQGPHSESKNEQAVVLLRSQDPC
mmetsp:Transcript_16833/g.36963  ORF Transcript_16833/g.36963 Transcript_16833/m.36963 type:complete len:83 (+) Transcript_16833:377-625(+)